MTRVTFRLFARKASRPTALCGLASFGDVVALLHHAQRALPAVSAFEVMWADYYRAALDATQGRDPLDTGHGYYVLLETEAADESVGVEALQGALAAALEDGLVRDAAVAQSAAQTAAFWRIRDGAAELIPAMSPVAPFDVGIPIARMEAFVDAARQTLARAFPSGQTLVFGHIADGNLHLLATPGTGDRAHLQRIYELVYEIVRQVGGTITAEHGIGATKRSWLGLCRSHAEIALMRRLKDALDPNGILNRHRVV